MAFKYVSELPPRARGERFEIVKFLAALRRNEWLEITADESQKEFGVKRVKEAVQHAIRSKKIKQKVAVFRRIKGKLITYYARLT